MFFFKRNKIVVDCFTDDAYAFEHTPITPANKMFPDWWKKLPIGNDGKRNMKKCIGFTQYHYNSYALPFWGGLTINMSDNNEKTYSWQTNYKIYLNDSQNVSIDAISSHNKNQFVDFVDDSFIHFKINSPWFFNCKQDTLFMMSDPVWHRQKLTDYTVLPGITDFRFQNSTNVNIMIEYRDVPRTITLPPGIPLVQITPLTEKTVDFKNHLITSKELIKYQPELRFIQHNSESLYSNLKRFKLKKEERTGKCPLGFGKK